MPLLKPATAVLLTFLFAGCTTGENRAPDVPADGNTPAVGERAPEASTPTSSDTTPGRPSPAASASLSEAEARSVLRTVYRPIRIFYQRIDTTGPGAAQPPEAMHTPEALVDTLTRTMAPNVARSFTDQLLMPRGDGYIVRPTERIVLPFEGNGPALEEVTISREDDAYVLTERYAETELYGRMKRRNVVRRTNGRWRLVEIRQ